MALQRRRKICLAIDKLEGLPGGSGGHVWSISDESTRLKLVLDLKVKFFVLQVVLCFLTMMWFAIERFQWP